MLAQKVQPDSLAVQEELLGTDPAAAAADALQEVEQLLLAVALAVLAAICKKRGDVILENVQFRF